METGNAHSGGLETLANAEAFLTKERQGVCICTCVLAHMNGLKGGRLIRSWSEGYVFAGCLSEETSTVRLRGMGTGISEAREFLFFPLLSREASK